MELYHLNILTSKTSTVYHTSSHTRMTLQLPREWYQATGRHVPILATNNPTPARRGEREGLWPTFPVSVTARDLRLQRSKRSSARIINCILRYVFIVVLICWITLWTLFLFEWDWIGQLIWDKMRLCYEYVIVFSSSVILASINRVLPTTTSNQTVI